MKSWIQTYSGLAFNVLEPNAMDVMIEDIAHALSNMCRFTGHTREFYSVAQHSVIASRSIREALPIGLSGAAGNFPEGPTMQMEKALLLHDASEAYLVDVPAPIKPHLHGYREIEERVMQAVALKFCIPEALFRHPVVKHVDLVMLATEKRDLLRKEPRPWALELPEPLKETIEPWPPQRAREEFLYRFNELKGVSL